MSRSYKKFVKRGICTGSNTEYYKERRKKVRSMNKQNLRNMMANYLIDEVSDLMITIELPHDDWNEPTDGTILIGRSSKKVLLKM